MKKLQSRHQIGDYVAVVFPPHSLLNCKVEAVKFKRDKILYDISVQMKRPDWGKELYTSIKSVDSVFVCKQGEEIELIGQRTATKSELIAILNKMDSYKLTEGFIATPTNGGQLTFYLKKPAFGGNFITRTEVLHLIDASE